MWQPSSRRIRLAFRSVSSASYWKSMFELITQRVMANSLRTTSGPGFSNMIEASASPWTLTTLDLEVTVMGLTFSPAHELSPDRTCRDILKEQKKSGGNCTGESRQENHQCVHNHLPFGSHNHTPRLIILYSYHTINTNCPTSQSWCTFCKRGTRLAAVQYCDADRRWCD